MLTKVSRFFATRFRLSRSSDGNRKFGTFGGVFTPTVLTILGVIMYLRTGQVVGNAGLIGALLIILLAHVITISTGLAVSSVATNIRVGAGGAFSIISQSLGLEVGGSIGIPLYLAQSVSVTLYVLGFTIAWRRIFDSHPAWLVAIITFLLVFGIAYVSMQFATRIQYLILALVGFSLFSIFLGSFTIAGHTGLTEVPVLWGDFEKWSFWETFAIFFPAVTGIMVGISLSGSLKNPQKSLPQGTLGAIGLTLVVYLLLTYWLSRAASVTELLENELVMVDKAYFGWSIYAGTLGATFSSALGSIVAAPRVMQALAEYSLLPFSERLSKETAVGEPRSAMMVTGAIGFAILIPSLFSDANDGLNSVASLISLFFLITYLMLNVVVLIEQSLGTVSFRPTFKIPRIVPLIGTIGCLFVMFLINPIFSLIAAVLVLLLYGFLARRNLSTLQSDVRSGLFFSIAEWAVKISSELPLAPERTWKPSLLVPVTSTAAFTGMYRVLWAIAAPHGSIQSLGIHPPGKATALKQLDTVTHAFREDGIYTQTTLLEESDFAAGVRMATQVLQNTFFRPNILFLNLRYTTDLDRLQQLVDKTAAYRMGIVLLARHPVLELGREQIINLWVSNQGPDWQHDLRQSNLDLAILLAYQFAQNWNGRINLCMAVADETTEIKATRFLIDLISLSRLSSSTKVIVLQSEFMPSLTKVPRADLSIFGLPKPSDLTFCRRIVDIVDSSCVFVRDSGNESALA
ncbi:MAG: Na-K-Cl cotransporter [Chloroflexi bacterium]|nr:Na-K-Cl cotransporter [Chloroflexota bacterium]